MFHILTFCVYIIELLSVRVLAEVQAYFLFYMFLDKTTYIDVRRAVGGRVDVEAVAVVTTQLFVDHDHSMVFHRLVGLDDGTHRWQRGHIPFNMTPWVVDCWLNKRLVVFDVKDAEVRVILWVCVKTRREVVLLVSLIIYWKIGLDIGRRETKFSPGRQTACGNSMDLRTDASLSTVSTLKMGPADFQEAGRNAPNLDQDKTEYRTRTRSDASNTRPVTEHL